MISFGAASSMRVASSLRGKAAEHHRMDGAEPGAGEHGERRFRHHRHVDDDAVALVDALVGEHGGQRVHLRQHLGIGEFPDRAGDGAVMDQRELVGAAASDMAVDGVAAGVAVGARKPAAIDAGLGVEDLVPGLEPVDGARRLGPERPRGRASRRHRPHDSETAWRFLPRGLVIGPCGRPCRHSL